jgi:hypothetical protein
VTPDRDTYRLIILHDEEGSEIGVPIRTIKRTFWQASKERTVIYFEDGGSPVTVKESPRAICIAINKSLSGQYEC